MKDEEQKKSIAAAREEAILKFWEENDVFNKSLGKDSPKGEYIFYEGPPTANGKPGIHHLEARAFKDAIPRYKTMQGYHVRRKGGWDTHGLPVELQVEKKLGLNSKKAIEEYGIAQFNKECKESVWEYLDIWDKFTKRIGYWIDEEHPYVTYNNDYIESVWNVFKSVNEKNLVYKDYKVVPWCPRCGTALSSHELAQGYQDDKDLSVYAKFELKDQPGVFFLAWTTTPWTLLGNVALAVGKDIEYSRVKTAEGTFILAKERLEALFEGKEYEIIETRPGSQFVGIEYNPLYPYLSHLNKEDLRLRNAYKVYAADFVTTTDGTGIVHTAVMYGADDFDLGTKAGLPKFHTVDDSGHFIKGTGFLEGRFVKDEEVAVDIIKDLAHRGLLFKKEKYEHSYPHCWRCRTPLIYYARDSWYIRMSNEKIKNELINENKKINWEPSYIRDGRFGEWLKDIKDWAISRERYWGTPLPIWVKADGGYEVIGSLDELKEKTKKSGNKYFVMRHGEADNNIKKILSSGLDAQMYLTKKGEQQIKESTKQMKGIEFDHVFVSPLVRTQQTLEVIKDEIDLSNAQIQTDDRLWEYRAGEFDEKPIADYNNHIPNRIDDFTFRPKDGECLNDVKSRVGDFLYDLESKYQNKNILIISHGDPIWMMYAITEGMTNEKALLFATTNYPQNAEFKKLDFVPLPHNEKYELDFHRPYIDEVKLVSKDGQEMTRVKEVMDVWFDSGAMPFAQDHYPFSEKKMLYPADYICEAIDQTRGWFYTLHAIGTLTSRGKAYKNVICLGHILDEKGKKMSKSLGNIVDPWEMIEKYGVDTLRLWMYSVNQPGESKNFDEKTVAELNNKVFNLLYNVLAFYELYRDPALEISEYKKSGNILDQWIVARLNEVIENTTKHMENYKLLEPVRGFRDFIDDLSTWYVRRSRERLKEGNTDAKETLYYILKTFTKVLAPFAPFAAEDIWQKLKNDNDEESVHLSEWPNSQLLITDYELIIKEMQKVREIVTLGLEARQKAGIKVRQPLNRLQVIGYSLEEKYFEIIKDELNIKDIELLQPITSTLEPAIELDTHLTPELRAEGQHRELVRAIQDMRKKQGLNPSDSISLVIETNIEGQELINTFKSDLLKTVGASDLKIAETEGVEIKIDELEFVIRLT